MPGPCFELLDHTADLRVRLRSASLEGLVACAAEAVRGLVFGDGAVGAGSVSRELTEQGDDFEEALVAFCNDILYGIWVESLVPVKVGAVRWTPPVLRARVDFAEMHDGLRPEREVKAATYSALELRREATGWVFDITFDV